MTASAAGTAAGPVAWRDDARPALLIAVGHAVSHFYQLAFAPLFPLWRHEFGLSWTQLGLVMTVFYAVSCLGQAASGFLVDRHGPRLALIAGFVTMGAGALAGAAATGYPGLLAAAVVIALGNSVFHPANFALLNDRISERRISHAYSLHGVSGTLGYASAPIVMSALALSIGWRPALVFASLAGFVMAVVVFWRRAEFSTAPLPPAATGAAAAPVFGFFNRALAACMLFFVTVNIAGIGVQNMGASLLTGLERMDALTAASWITGYIICVAAGMIVGGFLAAGRWRSDAITATGTLIAALMMLAIVSWPGLGATGTGIVLGIAGLALGSVQPARDLLVRSAVSRASTGRAYGIVYAAVDIGAALGPAVMGWWLDHRQPASGFMTAAVFLMLTAVAGGLISREVRRLHRRRLEQAGATV